MADALSRVPTTAVSSLNHTPTNASIRPLSQPSSFVPCNKTLEELTIDTLAKASWRCKRARHTRARLFTARLYLIPLPCGKTVVFFIPGLMPVATTHFIFRPSIIINKTINNSSNLSLKRPIDFSNIPSVATTSSALDNRQRQIRHGTSSSLMPCSTRWSPGITKPLSTPLAWTASKLF